jgi:aspartyl-tRNA(Asn)/glutamyl-tRNA(Gln) amidotransferase subunit A
MGKVEEKVKKYLSEIRRRDVGIKAFLSLNPNVIKDAREVDKKKKKGKLYGYVFGVKSNICVKGLIANCASRVLENYKATYDATVIEKIRKEGGVIIGMLNMDEFAAGGSGENSAFGTTDNPKARGRITGGSSSGAAAGVAAGFCDVALGSDTGGSIRNPASHCGVVGVKPSYGAVSRYGLIDLSMSLDQIGVLANNVEDVAKVLDVISGKDDKDTKCFEIGEIKLKKTGNIENGKFSSASTTRSFRGIKIGVIRLDGVDERIQKLIDEKVEDLIRNKGWNFEEIRIDHLELGVQTYYPIVYVEFFSGTRRFDGRRFGKKFEDFAGEEAMRRFLGGCEISKAEHKGAYYRKALEVKDLIKEEFSKVLKEVDCIISPVTPVLPWKIGEGKKMDIKHVYAADALTCPVNLAECCGISVPVGSVVEEGEEIPVGIQVVCGKGEDSKMLSIAKEVEHL